MLSILYLLALLLSADANYYKTSQGNVSFESNAAQEKIIGSSDALKGLIDSRTNTFSFSVELESFNGFNSQLQKEHYAENYVESNRFPHASFSGKIIEQIDFNKPGTYTVRAKGDLSVHGIRINKIIPATLTIISATQLKIDAEFQLNLTEFQIKVPRIVHKKVAENIEIRVDLLLNKPL